MSEQQASVINSTISSGKARAIMKVSTSSKTNNSNDSSVLDAESTKTTGKIGTLPTTEDNFENVQGSTPTLP